MAVPRSLWVENCFCLTTSRWSDTTPTTSPGLSIICDKCIYNFIHFYVTFSNFIDLKKKILLKLLNHKNRFFGKNSFDFQVYRRTNYATDFVLISFDVFYCDALCVFLSYYFMFFFVFFLLVLRYETIRHNDGPRCNGNKTIMMTLIRIFESSKLV